eukprot:TRINITY_DN182_c36_g1_i1.p2 TRINITY_DN182_c36_g1~~TRINITY_DN182_c36_g1_i1.p2  ORF type:complete len:553 (+),score=262.79 TRINITY_DN182_c36_g1_i1:90-1661(+)
MGGAPQSGYDAVIVCCSGVIEAAYWQQRLESSKGTVLPAGTHVFSVDEDWNGGGAGNGLGTLYAFQKAQVAAQAKGIDLLAKLHSGEFSVAIYHTAGKGTRLAPLPAAENNNKPGVKLPSTVKLADGAAAPITILEAVLKQTACYAQPRKGRLSVYWGDQIFIPSVDPAYTPTAHIDLLAQMLSELPTAEVWKAKGLAAYGLAVMFESGEGAQIEKVDHATATRMLESLGSIATVGPSLGSFSVSAAILAVLLKGYAKELEAKEGQLDTDPHFWMPLTLPKAAYSEVMGKKGWSAEQSNAHFDRMHTMLEGFDLAGKKLFASVNVGEDAYWWDYGQISFYLDNNLRLTQDGEENDAYRSFFGAQRGAPKDSLITDTKVDAGCSVASSELMGGEVSESALCNVTAGNITAKKCILVNVTAKKIVAEEGAIAYNVVDNSEEGLVLTKGKIVTTVFAEDGTQSRVHADMAGPDGKDAWSTVLPGNSHSYEQFHKLNKGVDPLKCEAAQRAAHKELAKTLGSKRANL